MPHVGPELTIPFTVGEGEPSALRLIEKLAPWNTGPQEAGLTDLERLLIAIGSAIFDPVLSIAEEEGEPNTKGWVPGYAKLLNPETCPLIWLPWLGMWVGVEPPKGASEAEARALVKNPAGWERGTVKAVEEAIRKNLTGAKAFKVLERHATNGSEDAYHFTILIFSVGEMPSEAALIQAVTEVKPAGVFFNISVGSLTYAVLEASHAKYSLVEAAHTKYTDTESEPSK